MTNPNGAFRTVVVPAAGMGTRFLPVTKSVPKELLPVLATPAIELAAGEAADAGARRLIIVTSPDKKAIIEYFRPDPHLERSLAVRGKVELLAKLTRATALPEIVAAVQAEALGLGHAVACAEPSLTDEDDAVAVILPDDIIRPSGVLRRMAEVRRRFGGTVMCAFAAPREQLSAYGVFDLVDTADPEVKRVRGMVEKPAPADAPSTFACAGRYLLDRAVFEPLRQLRPGPRGEIDLTDAVVEMLERGHPVHAVVHTGKRYDIGNPTGMLQATIDAALEDPVAGPVLRSWLHSRMTDLQAVG
jgi:UTP--glucose-1-phosphate uridylyltransferase